jgi:hypothetical protein
MANPQPGSISETSQRNVRRSILPPCFTFILLLVLCRRADFAADAGYFEDCNR